MLNRNAGIAAVSCIGLIMALGIREAFNGYTAIPLYPGNSNERVAKLTFDELPQPPLKEPAPTFDSIRQDFVNTLPDGWLVTTMPRENGLGADRCLQLKDGDFLVPVMCDVTGNSDYDHEVVKHGSFLLAQENGPVHLSLKTEDHELNCIFAKHAHTRSAVWKKHEVNIKLRGCEWKSDSPFAPSAPGIL